MNKAAMRDPQDLTEREKRVIIIGVLVAMMLAALDQTVIAPALPVMGASLGDTEILSWVVSGYFLASTAVVPVYGKLSDIHGRRPVLSAALILFLLGSILCALAPSMLALVIGRMVQGLGGGGLLSLAQTVIADIVAPKERGRYVAYISVMWASSSIAGPTLGGYMSEALGWASIFWLNVPLTLIALIVCRHVLATLRQKLKPHRIDYYGSALIVFASLILMLTLTWAGHDFAFLSPPTFTLLGVVGILCALLGLHITRAPHPIIPREIIKNRVVMLAAGGMFFGVMTYVGMGIYIPMYVQTVFDQPASHGGLALVPLLAFSVIGANTTGRMMARVAHYKRFSQYGLVLVLAGLLFLALFSGRLDIWQFEAVVSFIGLGLGPQFPTITVSVQNAVESVDMGVATATLAFLRALGSALGTSLLSVIAVMYGLDVLIAQSAQTEPLSLAVREAAAHAFSPVFFACMVATALGLVCVLAMEERPLRGHRLVREEEPLAAE